MTKVVEDIKANGPDVYKDTCACEYVNMSLTKAASTKFASVMHQISLFIDFIKNYSIPTAACEQITCFLYG